MTDDALRKECEQLAKQLWHSEACEPLQLVDALLRFAKQCEARGVRRVGMEAHRVAQVADAAIEGCDGDEWIKFNAIIAEMTHLKNWCDSTARELEKT